MTRSHACLALLLATTACGPLGCSGDDRPEAPADDVRLPSPAPCAPPAPTVTLAPSSSSASAPSGGAQAGTASAATEPRARAAKAAIDASDDDLADVDARLRIKRLVLARGVEQREPVGVATSFADAEGERVFAFVEVDNVDAAESAVLVSFVRKGQAEAGAVRLRVGPSPRWRTWAFTRQASKPGEWQVVVRNLKSEELARAPFAVVDGNRGAVSHQPSAVSSAPNDERSSEEPKVSRDQS